MIGEREGVARPATGIPLAGPRNVALHDRRAANLRNSTQSTALAMTAPADGVTISPLLLFILLIGGQCLAIIGCGMVPVWLGESGQDTHVYVEASIAGLGVALLFALIRPMIRLSTSNSRQFTVMTISVPATLAALGLAELAALGGYSYLAHFFGTTLPPVSFHHWLRAWAMATAAVGLIDLAASWTCAKWVRQGRLARRIVVYGGGEHGARFISDVAARSPNQLVICGYFDDRAEAMREPIAGVPCLGDSDRLIEQVRRDAIDEIVIALPWSAEQRILEILRRFRHLPVPIRLAPELIVLSAAEDQSPERGLSAALTIRDRPISELNLLVKDLFDRLLAFFLLVLLLPTMGVIACLIRLNDPGPVIFRQKRLGFNNRPFDVLKFRTMAQGRAQNSGVRQARRNDDRVTPVGRFLRRTSLDELPQLFNVLRGEMSLVGPRPHPIWTRADELWPDQGESPLEGIFSEYASRHRMKPGITGWAQVCGYRGETQTPDKMAKRIEHDIYYIENWSLWLDVRILARTLIAAVVDKNAY